MSKKPAPPNYWDAVRADAKARRAEALRMHREGMSSRKIAALWKISHQRVNAIIQKARLEAE